MRDSILKEAGTVRHGSSDITGQATQNVLQRLCEQLFQKRDMITSGRLRLIGLEQVKKQMGESWDDAKPRVYNTVEESIKKYMEPEDLFIRYHEDQYIVIFADATYEESGISTTLMAEEIRRRTFGIRRRELEGIRIKHEVRAETTQDIRIVEVDAYKGHLRQYAR